MFNVGTIKFLEAALVPVQFNNSGSLGGSSGLTWDGSFLTTSSIKNSALTSGRVTYAGASGLLSDSANLTYNGTNLNISYADAAYNAGLTVTNTTNNIASQTKIYVLNSAGNYLSIGRNSVALGSQSTIFSTGNFPLDFYTDSTQRMTILGTGNVGIGTSSPSYPLDLGAGTAQTTFRINSLGSSGYGPYIRFDKASVQKNLIGSYSAIISGTSDDLAYWSATGAGHQWIVNNGGSASMNLDSSGNLGLGVTPSAWFSGLKALQFGTAGVLFSNSDRANLASNVYVDSGTVSKYIGDGYALRYAQETGQHVWSSAPSGLAGNTATLTSFMTLDASGNLLVGTTSSIGNGGVLQAKGSGPVLYLETNNSGGTQNVLDIANVSNSAYKPMRFWVNGYPTTEVGSITCTTSATAYNTSSDYRLKENIVPMTGALATVAQLKPVTYKWKSDGSDGQGFIAHELQAIVPDCVTGEKDAVDKDGKPIHQGVDTSFLVATLVSAIQEQQTLIESLTTRLTALESK